MAIPSSLPETKYLGVTLSDNHHWDLHITNITNRASKTQVFEKEPKGRLHNHQEQAYEPLVRLTLECASPVWDQFTAENIYKPEAVLAEASQVAQTTNKADHFLQTPSQRDGHQFQLHTCPKLDPPFPPHAHPPTRLTQCHRQSSSMKFCLLLKLFLSSDHHQVELSSTRGGDCPLGRDI